jgi:hypothetical protein
MRNTSRTQPPPPRTTRGGQSGIYEGHSEMFGVVSTFTVKTSTHACACDGKAEAATGGGNRPGAARRTWGK